MCFWWESFHTSLLVRSPWSACQAFGLQLSLLLWGDRSLPPCCSLQTHCSWSSFVCLCCYCVLVCTYTSILRMSSSFDALLHSCWGCQEKHILTMRLHLQQCCVFPWCRLSQDHILWVLISIRLGVWRTQQGSGLRVGTTWLLTVNVNCQYVGGCCLWLCSFCGSVLKFGSKIFVWRGVFPEFDYFKKFQVFQFLNPWHQPKVVTKWDLAGRKF